MKNVHSLTIGIPVFNEEKNIQNILRDLLDQDYENLRLDGIHVVSDGSTDSSAERINELESNLIFVTEFKKRSGKASCVNYIFKKSHSDVVIIIDGDTRILDKDFIQKMMHSVTVKGVDLASAHSVEVKPKTLVGAMLHSSMSFKKRIYKTLKGGNSIYTCYGYARAFSKKLYSDIAFPDSVGEDAYSYLFAKSKGFKYASNKKAMIYYKLPNSLSDHSKQSVRFFHSQKRFYAEFGEKFVKREYMIPGSLMLVAFIQELFVRPIIVFYFGIVLYLKVKSQFTLQTHSAWSVAKSSKVL